MNERKLVTKRDIAVLAVLVFFAIALLLLFRFGLKDGRTALISVDGRDYMTVPLDKDDEITLENGVRIIVSDGKIGFSESDCPDLVCVHTGMLSKAGDVAACVPNKTVISVSGGEASVDTLTY
ncbi:MAG: NusG domain II-containing protein [Clostridiaceae bacterium]|nr:NusG domain II-containing protein [Clostridiaceae bacterium]